MNELVKSNNQGQNVTTSLIVAEIFGKRHDHVLRDIKNLDCPEDFSLLNFGETPYTHPQNGQEYPMYEMTKDGFSFLVMGYTGAKAAKFKVDFINEFNKREDMLKSDEYILMRSQQILQQNFKALEMDLYRHKEIIEVQNKEIKAIAPKAEYYDEVLQSSETYATTRIAMELGLSAKALNKKLSDLKVQYKVDGQWIPYSKYLNGGYTKSHTVPYIKNDGTTGTNTQTVWTEKGRKFIHELLTPKQN